MANYDNKSLTKNQMIQSYHDMLSIRKMEEEIARLYSQGKIGGFCHLYIGQESIGSGIKMASVEGDSFITSYRAHGFSYLCGASAEAIIAELLGRETGVSKGKGGSMHMFDAKNHFYGGHGIVGAQASLGTGIAFANQYLKNNKVCFTLMGDGGYNQGQVYESFNMAKLWNLPVVYVIENNQYSMGTSLNRGCANAENMAKRSEGWGIPSMKINAMNVEEVYSAMSYAREYALKNGPICIDCITYRYKGHSMSDPAKYRTKDEVAAYKKKDCIELIKQHIVDKNFATEDELKNIAKDIKKKTTDAAKLALSANRPELKELYTDVLCESN